MENKLKKTASIAVLAASLAVLVIPTIVVAKPPGLTARDYKYVSRTINQSFRASCSASLKPDYSVIPGGMSSESAEPKEAINEINANVRKIRSFVKRHGGRLVLKERVRSVKRLFNSRYPRRRYPAPMQPGKPVNPTTFVITQFLEIRMPVRANVDKVMLGLIKRGMNRFGKNTRYRGTQPQVVVYYRFNNLVKRLDKIKDACIMSAIESWCRARALDGDVNACVSAIGKVKGYLRVQSLSLQAGPIMHYNGTSRSIYLRYPWQQRYLDMMELIGNVEVPVFGSIYLRAPSQYGW
jgi:hypothetical protein